MSKCYLRIEDEKTGKGLTHECDDEDHRTDFLSDCMGEDLWQHIRDNKGIVLNGTRYKFIDEQ